MTNKEAVKIFKERLAFGEKEYSDVAKDYIEAIKTAISALRGQEKEPCEFCGSHDLGDKRLFPKIGYQFYAGYSKQEDVDEFDEEEVEDINFCPMCGRQLKLERLDSVNILEDESGAIKLAISALRAQSAKDTNVLGKWISVEDRPPEEKDRVIGYYPSMAGTSAAIQICVGWNMMSGKEYGVKYWMPLPEPPKG